MLPGSGPAIIHILDEGKRSPFLKIDWVLSQFGRSPEKAKRAYRRYVLEGIQGKSPRESLKGQIFLGTEEFLARIREPFRAKGLLKEVPRVQRYAARPSLAEILGGKKQRAEGQRMKYCIRPMWNMGIGWSRLLNIWEFIMRPSAGLSGGEKDSVRGLQECSIARPDPKRPIKWQIEPNKAIQQMD
jgi:hypothetical protein